MKRIQWIGKYLREPFPKRINNILNTTPFHRGIAFGAKMKHFSLQMTAFITFHNTFRAEIYTAFGTKPVGSSRRMIITELLHIHLL
jgi:hypothetical protein